jgi:hypothetical protein
MNALSRIRNTYMVGPDPERKDKVVSWYGMPNNRALSLAEDAGSHFVVEPISGLN